MSISHLRSPLMLLPERQAMDLCGHIIPLSPAEYRLMEYLDRGPTLKKAGILEISDSTLSVHIASIRALIKGAQLRTGVEKDIGIIDATGNRDYVLNRKELTRLNELYLPLHPLAKASFDELQVFERRQSAPLMAGGDGAYLFGHDLNIPPMQHQCLLELFSTGFTMLQGKTPATVQALTQAADVVNQNALRCFTHIKLRCDFGLVKKDEDFIAISDDNLKELDRSLAFRNAPEVGNFPLLSVWQGRVLSYSHLAGQEYRRPVFVPPLGRSFPSQGL